MPDVHPQDRPEDVAAALALVADIPLDESERALLSEALGENGTSRRPEAGGSRSIARSGGIRSTRTFWASSPLRPGATSNSTLLALVEGLVAVALDVGEVDEHVVALLAGDEAEALLGVEELHGTCSPKVCSLRGSRQP